MAKNKLLMELSGLYDKNPRLAIALHGLVSYLLALTWNPSDNWLVHICMVLNLLMLLAHILTEVLPDPKTSKAKHKKQNG